MLTASKLQIDSVLLSTLYCRVSSITLLICSSYNRVRVHLLGISLQRILHPITISFRFLYSTGHFNMGWPKVGHLGIKWFGSTYKDQLRVQLINQAKLKPVSNLEKLLVGTANSNDFSEHLEELLRSCFGTDIDCGRLGHQFYLMLDRVKTTLPEVPQVTNIRTICEGFNKTPVTKMLLG